MPPWFRIARGRTSFRKAQVWPKPMLACRVSCLALGFAARYAFSSSYVTSAISGVILAGSSSVAATESTSKMWSTSLPKAA